LSSAKNPPREGAPPQKGGWKTPPPLLDKKGGFSQKNVFRDLSPKGPKE